MATNKSNQIQYDDTMFQDIKSHAADLQAAAGDRDTQFTKYEDAYLLRWSNAKLKKFGKGARATISPDMRNELLGAVRLLTATDPTFSLDKGGTEGNPNVENLEAAMDRTWNQAGKILGLPIHHDLITMALLYG